MLSKCSDIPVKINYTFFRSGSNGFRDGYDESRRWEVGAVDVLQFALSTENCVGVLYTSRIICRYRSRVLDLEGLDEKIIIVLGQVGMTTTHVLKSTEKQMWSESATHDISGVASLKHLEHLYHVMKYRKKNLSIMRLPLACVRKKFHPEIGVPFTGNVLDQWSRVFV